MERLLRVRYEGQKKAFFALHISKTVIQNNFRKFPRKALVQNRVAITFSKKHCTALTDVQ